LRLLLQHSLEAAGRGGDVSGMNKGKRCIVEGWFTRRGLSSAQLRFQIPPWWKADSATCGFSTYAKSAGLQYNRACRIDQPIALTLTTPMISALPLHAIKRASKPFKMHKWTFLEQI